VDLISILLINLAAIAALTFLLWLVSLPLRDASIVDIFWGLGFVAVAWLSSTLAGFPGYRSLLVAALATIWGVRLSGYLAWRNIGHTEDRRYREMRARWGGRFPVVSLFTVFWLQALILWIVAFPLQTAAASEISLNLIDLAGVALWLIGLIFETVGDAQLARFKADPANAGRVLQSGLWRYTRHPNYFGDFLVWWGFYLVAAAGGAWWTVFSPLLMSVLLMKVSGVALLERSIAERRPEYRDYIERTNAFFPWPPRRN